MEMDSDPSLSAIAAELCPELGLGGLLSISPCAGQRQWRFGNDHTLCPGSNVEVLMSGNVRCYNIVVDAMKAFPSSENIQAVSCCLLHRLSLGEWPFLCWPDHGVCVGVSLSLGTMLTSAVLMEPYLVCGSAPHRSSLWLPTVFAMKVHISQNVLFTCPFLNLIFLSWSVALSNVCSVLFNCNRIIISIVLAPLR